MVAEAAKAAGVVAEESWAVVRAVVVTVILAEAAEAGTAAVGRQREGSGKAAGRQRDGS